MTTQAALTTQVHVGQKLVAGLGGLVAAIALLHVAHNDAWKVALAVFALVAAALVVHSPAFGPQLVARAVWWSNLGLGTAFCVFGGSRERGSGLVIAFGCGIALLVIGRKGLAEASERARYAPAAFRSSLLLLMALALADAQTVLLFGILSVTGFSPGRAGGLIFVVVGGLFALGFAGLYRLRLWGALLNVFTAAAFGVVLLTQPVHFDREVSQLLLALCAGQLVAAAPMMIGLVRQKPLPSAPAWLRGVGASGVVIAMMLLCTVLAFRD